jgi:hypothetical protein
VGRFAALPGLHPEGYVCHGLHAPTSIWVEKNCYVDIWIEVLHSLALQPHAMLGFTLAIDFEGDQWTFFKPRHDVLRELYGVDVQELNLWRSLGEHAREHLASGKLISVEADAFWLPDTAGTDYRRNHVKTTIVLNDVDFAEQTAAYFHNAGYFAVEGDDFEHLFAPSAEGTPTPLPLYAEFVRTDRLVKRDTPSLARLSAELLLETLEQLPIDDPVQRFQERFKTDLCELRKRGLDYYHQWAFATVRQLGAALELSAEHLRWLEASGVCSTGTAAESFTAASQACKTLILKAARSVSTTKPADTSSLFADIGAVRNQGISALRRSL